MTKRYTSDEIDAMDSSVYVEQLSEVASNETTTLAARQAAILSFMPSERDIRKFSIWMSFISILPPRSVDLTREECLYVLSLQDARPELMTLQVKVRRVLGS